MQYYLLNEKRENKSFDDFFCYHLGHTGGIFAFNNSTCVVSVDCYAIDLEKTRFMWFFGKKPGPQF
jgi:hypothetical protein